MQSSNTVDLGRLVSACIDLAQRAGAVIREVQKSGKLEVKQKGPDDPCTRADLAAQELIVGGLLHTWPKLSIIGEEDTPMKQSELQPRLDLVPSVPEHFKSVAVEDIAVFIDPLDATKEFTLGLYHCCMTLIGISVKGVPAAGIMYQPFVDDGKTYWGIVGQGVHGIEKRGNADTKFILAVTSSHWGADTEEAVAAIKPDELLKAGGAGYKSLLVLQGIATVYVQAGKGTKKWDTCAPEAILRSVGGVLTDIHGKPYTYEAQVARDNLHGLIAACNQTVHQRVVQALAAKLK